MGSHLIAVSACLLQHVGSVRKSVSAGCDSDLTVLLDNLVCLECEWSRHMCSLATSWKLTPCRKPLSCQVVNKFPVLYRALGLNYVCRNLSLARWTASYLCTVLYDSLILSCHLCLGFPCGLIPSGYQVSCLDILLLLLGLWGGHQNPRPCMTFCSYGDCPPNALQVGWPLHVSHHCLFNASAGAIQECRRFFPSIASGWLMMPCESVCISISSTFLKVMLKVITDILI